MVRPIGTVLGLLLALLVSSSARANDDDRLDALKKRLRAKLSEVAGDEVDLRGGNRGHIYKARGPGSVKDRKLMESLVERPLPWAQEDGLLRDYIGELEKVWDLKVRPSKKVRKLIDDGARVPAVGGPPETMDHMLRLAGDKAGEKLVWSVRAGAITLYTADEEEDDREAHRELVKSLIEEIAGESAKFLGDRYLLLYVEEKAPTEEAKRIRSVLATRKVTLNFEDTPFDAVTAFLRDISDVNIVLSKEIEEEASGLMVTLQVRELRLENALNLILSGTGEDLEWTIKNDVLFIRTQEEGEKARSSRSFILIDISDILYIPPDYPAPKLGLGGLKRER